MQIRVLTSCDIMSSLMNALLGFGFLVCFTGFSSPDRSESTVTLLFLTLLPFAAVFFAAFEALASHPEWSVHRSTVHEVLPPSAVEDLRFLGFTGEAELVKAGDIDPAVVLSSGLVDSGLSSAAACFWSAMSKRLVMISSICFYGSIVI